MTRPSVRPLGPILISCLLFPTAVRADAPEATDGAPAVLDAVTVTANRLKNARIDLSPKVGTSIYTIDTKAVEALSQGADSSFDEVLLHLPGVEKDSKASGSLHVRDDHGNVQYRINGVQLPENISGFGSALDTRFIDKVDFLTGALPAQYGLRSAGVVEIETKEGKIAPGGELSLGFGSHRQFAPSAEAFGSLGAVTWYLSGSTLSSAQGIENPQATTSAQHDHTRQERSFGTLSYYLDDASRLALIFGTYSGRFQIPSNPGQGFSYALAGYSDPASGRNAYPSSAIDENQRESNRFLVGSFQRTVGTFDYQIAVFHQTSELHFLPDPVGDLIFNGVASDIQRSNRSSGLQFDLAWKLGPLHTMRVGTEYTHQDTASTNATRAFVVDATGAQQPPYLPITVLDASRQAGTLASLYIQDEYHPEARLTLNYGVRFDRVDAFIQEQQWSPRLNAAYKLTPDTFLHAGFSRYFTPPPQELSARQSVGLFAGTSNQPMVRQADEVRAERSNYFDIGLGHSVSSRLTMAVDAYYKQLTQLIDEGQFGQALILSPFNYASGYVQGVELSTTYNGTVLSGYANLAYQKAKASRIDSSQALFTQDRLDYIARHDIYLDHDQTWTASAGSSYRMDGTQFSLDALFGSGLRRTGSDGIPNGQALPGYAVFNSAVSHSWGIAGVGDLEARLALLNMLDRVYLLRDGTGVGVGAPQYGPRRTIYGSLSVKL